MTYPKYTQNIGHSDELIGNSSRSYDKRLSIGTNLFLPQQPDGAFGIKGTIDVYLLFREEDGWTISGVFKADLLRFFETNGAEIKEIDNRYIYVDYKIKTTEEMVDLFEKMGSERMIASSNRYTTSIFFNKK